MRGIETTELINSEEYIREPVDKVVNEILKSNEKRIILPAGRGTGRSTVLYALENRGLGSDEQTIYYNPEIISIIGKKPNKTYNKSFFNTFHELLFTNRILHYISSNYPIAFEKYFKDDQELVKSILKRIEKEINNTPYSSEKIKISNIINVHVLSLEIVERFKKIFDIKNINLAIDRFDMANGSSKHTQKLYEKQFDMFDKVILAVNDSDIDKESLLDRGYSTKELSYGSNKDILREIIRRRVRFANKGKSSEDFYTSDYFMNEIMRVGSNIDMALEALNFFDDFSCIYPELNTGEIIEKGIEERKERTQLLEKTITKPTFYL